MSAPRQLALALPHAESFAREDFLVGASNNANNKIEVIGGGGQGGDVIRFEAECG